MVRLFKVIWFVSISFVLYIIIVLVINWYGTQWSTLFYFLYNKNLLGLSLFYTGVLCGIFIFLLSDVKLFFHKNLNILLLVSFVISIWFFINESNLLNLFILYELFLLPSFYLVYRLSPNRRSIIAAIYFLTWTQFGSLLVLIGIIASFYITGNFNLYTNNIIYDQIIFWLVFLGFGIKIPMWPFYYWLTKTHVEASSFFSMYLSGFLVKTAVFLFIKFYAIFSIYNFINIFLHSFQHSN